MSTIDLTRLSGYARAMTENILRATGLDQSRIISGHRDAGHNAAVGGAKFSQHIHGNAIDIDISGMDDRQKAAVLEAAVAAGARGVGIYPSGNSLHVDVRQTPALWGLKPGAAYSGMSPENAPAWARPALTALFGRTGAGGPVDAANPMSAYFNEASSRFGVSASFLAAVARRESTNNPNAKNPNSTAAGLFQFTDDTWNRMMAKYGEKLGMAGASPYDPRAATMMAALLAKENSLTIGTVMGRPITDGELYAAHFLGARQTVTLLRAVQDKPDAEAVTMFPAEAAVNGKIFFNQDGTPRSVKEVYASLTELPAADGGDAAAPAVAPATPAEKEKDATSDFKPVSYQATVAKPSVAEIKGPAQEGGGALDRLQRRVAARGKGLVG